MSNIIHRLSSLGLATVLSFGVFVVWLFALGMTYVPIKQHLREDDPYESMLVLPNGTPVIRDHSSRNDSHYRSLDGKVLEGLDDRIGTMNGVWLPGPSWKESPWRGIPWRQRFMYVTDYNWRRQNENWYLVHDGRLDGSGYFAGYDAKSRRCLGYIGKNGFLESEPPENDRFPFDGRLINAHYKIIATLLTRTLPSSPGSPPTVAPYYQSLIGLLTAEGLYVVNFNQRTSKCVWKDADLCSMGISDDPIPHLVGKDSNSYRYFAERGDLIIRQSNRVSFVDDEGKQVRSYELPPDIRDADFQWYELGEGKAMIVVTPYSHVGLEGQYHIYWLENGRSVRHQELFLKGLHRPLLPVETAILTPSPIMIFLLGSGILDNTSQSMMSPRMRLQEEWVGYSILGAACIALAWLCYRRQRAFGLPWTGAWVAFVLLLGVPGYLGYLAHRRWPALLPCPHCGQNAPRDRSACLHCGRDFPAPELTGTEVFLRGS